MCILRAALCPQGPYVISTHVHTLCQGSLVVCEKSFHAQAMAWAAFNGAGLAFVLPCAQSILADYYIPEQRGRAFGFMFTLAALGEASQSQCIIIESCKPVTVLI